MCLHLYQVLIYCMIFSLWGHLYDIIKHLFPLTLLSPPICVLGFYWEPAGPCFDPRPVLQLSSQQMSTLQQTVLVVSLLPAESCRQQQQLLLRQINTSLGPCERCDNQPAAVCGRLNAALSVSIQSTNISTLQLHSCTAAQHAATSPEDGSGCTDITDIASLKDQSAGLAFLVTIL